MSKHFFKTVFLSPIPYSKCLVKWLIRGTILLLLLRFCYECLPQSSTFRCGSQWHNCMQNGNSSSAIYWANWIIWHTPSNHPSYGYGYECRAKAYELAGEYEKALEDYIKAESWSNRTHSLPLEFMGRLFYKRGEKAKAYEYYIKALSKSPLLEIQSFLENNSNKRQRSAQVITDIVYGWQGGRYEKLNPYSSYDEFLDFMESEHKFRGFPEENRIYLQILRDVKDDVNSLK